MQTNMTEGRELLAIRRLHDDDEYHVLNSGGLG
jgi:hypothetical protein